MNGFQPITWPMPPRLSGTSTIATPPHLPHTMQVTHDNDKEDPLRRGVCHDPQHASELAGLIPTAPDPMMSHRRRKITTNTQSGNQEWDINTRVHTSMHQPI